MTGAPKLRSVHLLESLEQHPRGPYSGTLGYFSITGSCQFNVIIRTASFCSTPKEGSQKISIGAGGAIVSISDVEGEFEEMILKSESVMNSLKQIYL